MESRSALPGGTTPGLSARAWESSQVLGRFSTAGGKDQPGAASRAIPDELDYIGDIWCRPGICGAAALTLDLGSKVTIVGFCAARFRIPMVSRPASSYPFALGSSSLAAREKKKKNKKKTTPVRVGARLKPAISVGRRQSDEYVARRLEQQYHPQTRLGVESAALQR